MNLIRGYIGFVGLLVSIIGFMILAYAWADGTDPFIGWVVTGVGVLMWLQCLPMLRREEERKRHLSDIMKGKRD